MDLYEALRARRSVRSYRPNPVPQDVLDRLVEAAQWAPSWAHTQCLRLLLVTEGATKLALQEALTPANPARKALLEAPLVAVFCAVAGRAGFYKAQASTVRGDWFMFDVALGMENFMLAACAEGLGTVCVGAFDPVRAGRAVNAPAGIEVVALTPLGYPAAETKVPPRMPKDEFLRWESF